MKRPLLVSMLVIVVIGLIIVSTVRAYNKPIQLTAPAFSTARGALKEVEKAYDLKPHDQNRTIIFPSGYLSFVAWANDDEIIRPGPVGLLIDIKKLAKFGEDLDVWGQICSQRDFKEYYTKDGTSLFVPVSVTSDDPSLLQQCAELYPASVQAYLVTASPGETGYPITVTLKEIPVVLVNVEE